VDWRLRGSTVAAGTLGLILGALVLAAPGGAPGAIRPPGVVPSSSSASPDPSPTNTTSAAPTTSPDTNPSRPGSASPHASTAYPRLGSRDPRLTLPLGASATTSTGESEANHSTPDAALHPPRPRGVPTLAAIVGFGAVAAAAWSLRIRR